MNTRNLVMYIGLLALAAATSSIAGEIPSTDLVYQGPGSVNVITDHVAEILKTAPYGGVPSVPPGTVIVQISNAGTSANLIFPRHRTSAQAFALFVEGSPSVLYLSCGQAGGAGVLPYLYVSGAPKKILLSGMAQVGKIVVSNAGDNVGVHIQNISTSKGNAKKGGHLLAGSIHSVITVGALKRLQTNHGSFGGTATAPGVIAIGTDSPKGQIKCSTRGAIAHVLICKTLQRTNQFDYVTAYQECIASNAVLPYVVKTQLHMINAKAIGPAVLAVKLSKTYQPNQLGTRLKITRPLPGEENLLP
ncbi:MAG: hypothetical protein N2595_00345 [bacterium]|nr:hypothetical protein [bacterium]